MRSIKAGMILALAIGSVILVPALAGDLEPPGTPAPTMVTLQQIYDQLDECSGGVPCYEETNAPEGSLEPPGPPAPTMVTLQQIYDKIGALDPPGASSCTGVGSEPQTTQVQQMIDDAAAAGRILYLEGAYPIDDTIYIKGPIEARNASLCVLPDFGDIAALRLYGDDYDLAGRRFALPNVINLDPDRWNDHGTGITVRNLRQAHVEVGHVRNFYNGLLLYGANGAGTVYNSFFISHLENNQHNLRLVAWGENSAETSGWVNQNNFFGGRYSHWSGPIEEPYCHHVFLDNQGSVHSGPNTNTWYGASFEGNVPEYNVRIRGSYNVFVNCRWETSGGGRVFLSNTADTHRNRIIQGYGAHNINKYGKSSALAIEYMTTGGDVGNR